MDWPYSQNASHSNCKYGSLLDARWEKEERKTKGDMEKNSGKMELFGDPGQEQTTVNVNCCGLTKCGNISKFLIRF